MTNVALRSVKPVKQSGRIAALRASLLVIIPATLFVDPLNQENVAGEVMTQAGLLLILIGIFGRFWSILYIGGFKNAAVIQGGPYSMCRHPLYLFSTVAAVGFGLMLQSFVLATLIGAVVFLILNVTAAREEAYLESRYGIAYIIYAAVTPRIIPHISLFSSSDEVTFGVQHLRNNLFDALVFAALIPLSELIGWLRDFGTLPGLVLI